MREFSWMWILICAIGAAFLGSSTIAQESQAQAAADQLFASSNWEKAAEAYTRVTAAEPNNGLAWQNLGECRLQMKQYGEAVRDFKRSEELKFRPLANQVNIARVYAEEGDRAEVFKILEQIADSESGGRMRPFIGASSEFARYKEDAQYKALMEKMLPCRTAEYRQFDFWAGDWEVQDAAKNVLGQNLVTQEQNGCLLVEHWKDAAGMQTGTSFNYYDIRDKKWHQLYLDNSGNAGAFPAMAGELTNGRMVLLTDEKDGPVSRWTWYAITPDKVRQMAEQTTDSGKTWQVTWDSFYVRKRTQEGSSIHPCQQDARYRAFDFWVGEWEVRPTGQPDAKPQHSKIEQILGGCVIFESYSYDVGVYEGKSFNVFDLYTGLWHQTYVDSRGTRHEWDGEVRDNVMYYLGANLTGEGGRTWDRITYSKLPNGHVRHLSQRSKDGGRTWETYFDGDYSPMNSKSSEKR
jgi:hypothetical protein